MFQMSSSFYGKCSFTVKSVSWKRIHFGDQKLFVSGFSVKILKYFGFKDESSLGCEAPWEAAQSRAVTATRLLAGAAHSSPPMDPGQGDQVRWKNCPRTKVRGEECYCSSNTSFSFPCTLLRFSPYPYPHTFSAINTSSSLSKVH